MKLGELLTRVSLSTCVRVLEITNPSNDFKLVGEWSTMSERNEFNERANVCGYYDHKVNFIRVIDNVLEVHIYE